MTEMLKVYLSGGMAREWQSQVIEAVPNLAFINPQWHDLHVPAEYTMWDLLGVKQCDVLFAYFEATNPSGIGMAIEMGYAKALGKTVIFVDAHGGYTRILREMADTWCRTLEEGLHLLWALTRMDNHE